MASKTEEPIDETPISSIERRDSLEKHLQTRPDVKDLKDRHILLDTNAAPFVDPMLSRNVAKTDVQQITPVKTTRARTPACNR